jgi:LPXTG-motif cell wall-anchored protein
MFALFNLGMQEIVILLVLGLLLVGGPILYLRRRSKQEGDLDD